MKPMRLFNYVNTCAVLTLSLFMLVPRAPAVIALPDRACVIPTHPGADKVSYFDIQISQTGLLDGTYLGWCVDTDRNIGPGSTYTALLVWSTDPNAGQGLVEHPENLDLVNYILNQNYPSRLSPSDDQPYTYSDVQRAIWALIEDQNSLSGLDVWTQAHVDEIVADAQANGEGFVPGCGQVMALILNPVLKGCDWTTTATDPVAQVILAVVPAGCLGDYVWNDLNADGIQQPNEPGLAGVAVHLLDCAGNVLQTTTTDAQGHYLFTGLKPGLYNVHVDAPAGFVFSPADQGTDDAADSDADPTGAMPCLFLDLGAQDLTWDAGLYQCTGAIGDYVWFDLNRNGVQDENEAGLPNVRVVLYDANANFLAETVTDAQGAYLFTGLCAGDYLVDVDESSLPNGYLPTVANAGSDDALDSDSDQGAPVAVSLPLPDTQDLTIDFGFIYDCHDCQGGVVQLTLYYGGPDADVAIYAGKEMDSANLLFADHVSNGGLITFQGNHPDLTMGKEISIWVNGELQGKIHTSCSRPIGPGLVVGDFRIIEGYSRDGGLLCPVPDCGECDGQVTQLTLQYAGPDAEIVVVAGKTKDEDSKGDCDRDDDGDEHHHGKKSGHSRKKDRDGDEHGGWAKGAILFQGTVATGESFTFTGAGSNQRMGPEISIYVNGRLAARIHTSCSQPIGPGLVVGDFTVLDGYSRDGGRLCPLPPQPPQADCGPCDGKVTQLTLQYNGTDAPLVEVYDKKGNLLGSVQLDANGVFTIDGAGLNADKNGTLGTEIALAIGGAEVARIHTSCSQPIAPGMVFGPFTILDGYSRNGGRLCPLP